MKIKILIYCCIYILSIAFVNAQSFSYEKIGIASYYGDKFEGRQTANGEIYYHAKKTAAHQKLPFGTIVKVTNLENNKYVVVRINDRGPFVDNRIIDLSKSAAREIGFVEKGLTKVKIEVIANTNDLPDKKPDNLSSQQNDLKTYYQIDSKIVKPKGKGIQIGSYTDDENMIKIVAGLKTRFKEKVFVEIAIVNELKLYRVIIGTSNDNIALEHLKSQLKKEFPDCFIVEYK